MKRLLSLKLFGFMVIFPIIFFCLTPNSAESKDLKWAVFVPQNAYDSPPLMQFIKNIETYTNGEIKIKIFWPGEIADVKEMPELTRRGSLDMTTTAPVFYPSIFPLNVALQSFPMVFKSPEQATYTWRGLLRDIPELQKEFTDFNQYCLNRGTLAMYDTLSKKPLRTVADLKGVKLRFLPGKYMADILRKAGGVPIVNPISEVYEGLMRGSLDAVSLNLQVFDSLKFYEAAKYVSLSVGTPVGYWISINLDVWNGFSPKIKEAFTRASNEWGASLMDLVLSSKEESIKNLKAKGVQFIDFDQKAWNDLVYSVGDPWVVAKDYLSKDLKVDAALSERFINRWHELVDEYEKNYASAGKTWKYE